MRVAVMRALHHSWEAIVSMAQLELHAGYTHSGFWWHMAVFLGYVLVTAYLGFIPTIAIGFLAAAAVIMTLRDDDIKKSRMEKIVWIFITFGLLIVEVLVASNEHNKQVQTLIDEQTSFSSMLAQERQNFQLSRQTQDMLRSFAESEKQKSELQARINIDQPKSRAEALRNKSLPPVSLKRRLSELSADIFSFLAARQAAEPESPIPSTPNFRQEMEKYFAGLPSYLEQTMTLYDQSFTKRVEAIHDALIKQGIRDDQLDEYYKDPTNKFGIEILARRLGVIAENLKQ